jgi:hypothetical protein
MKWLVLHFHVTLSVCVEFGHMLLIQRKYTFCDLRVQVMFSFYGT